MGSDAKDQLARSLRRANIATNLSLVSSIVARADLTEDSDIKEIGSLALEQVNEKIAKASSARRIGSYPARRNLLALNSLINEHPNREAIFGSDSKWELNLPEALRNDMQEDG